MRIVMMGTGSFAEPTFHALLESSHQVVGLVTQPDRVTGKERASTKQARRGMKELAQEHAIPVAQPESVNTAEGMDVLREWRPDLLVVAAYGQILSREVLSLPAQGGINVHASLLPKYRGAAPIAWAIYHGESETGVTIIRMSTALDAGDLLAQEKVAIGADETAGELETRLAELGARLAVTVVGQFEAGTVRGVPQDKAQATKAPKLTKEHGLIDWSRSASAIRNHVRAMQPWPTAFTYLHRPQGPPLRLIIYQVRSATIDIQLTPGTEVGFVRHLDGQAGLFVVTGAGDLVEIVELQPSGKRRMAAADFLRGHAVTSGWRMRGESA